MNIAVYGTLRQGEYNHDLIDGPLVIGGRVHGWKMLTNGSFPNAMRSVPNDSILVEVYDITDNALSNINMLEGYPDFYDRVKVEVDGVEAEMYCSNNGKYQPLRNGCGVIESGDWLKQDG